MAACLLATPAFAEELAGPYYAEVLEVIDGDTVRAKVQVWIGQSVETTVRIRDIDTPELRRKCPGEREAAAAARDHLALVLRGGTVSLLRVGPDKYGGRIDAALRLPSGEDVAAAMIASGHARAPVAAGGANPGARHRRLPCGSAKSKASSLRFLHGLLRTLAGFWRSEGRWWKRRYIFSLTLWFRVFYLGPRARSGRKA